MTQSITKLLVSAALLTLAAGHAAAYSFAAPNKDGKTIYYNILSDNTCEVTYNDEKSYSTDTLRYTGTVSIPQEITNNGTTYTVTRIGEDAFYRCYQLEAVSIPSTVTTIGNYAFCYCSALSDIGSLPEWAGFDWCMCVLRH